MSAHPVVALHNVEDVFKFVYRSIRTSGVKLTPDEFEELSLEGVAIMCKLAKQYDPAKDKRGSTLIAVKTRVSGMTGFAGYAKYLLPRKLSDAYHRMHPEFVSHTDADGKRHYEYGDAPRSLSDAVTETGELSDAIDSHRTRLVGDFAQ